MPFTSTPRSCSTSFIPLVVPSGSTKGCVSLFQTVSLTIGCLPWDKHSYLLHLNHLVDISCDLVRCRREIFLWLVEIYVQIYQEHCQPVWYTFKVSVTCLKIQSCFTFVITKISMTFNDEVQIPLCLIPKISDVRSTWHSHHSRILFGLKSCLVMHYSNVLLLCVDNIWTWLCWCNGCFIQLGQILEQYCPKCCYIITFMVIKKFTLLIVTDIETKVVEPLLSCFKSDDDIKAVLHPFAKPLCCQIWFTLPVNISCTSFRVASWNSSSCKIALGLLQALPRSDDSSVSMSSSSISSSEPGYWGRVLKYATAHFTRKSRYSCSKLGSFYNSYIELCHCCSHHLNGHGFLYLPRHILSIYALLPFHKKLFVVCVNMIQSFVRLTLLLFYTCLYLHSFHRIPSWFKGWGSRGSDSGSGSILAGSLWQAYVTVVMSSRAMPCFHGLLGGWFWKELVCWLQRESSRWLWKEPIEVGRERSSIALEHIKIWTLNESAHCTHEFNTLQIDCLRLCAINFTHM